MNRFRKVKKEKSREDMDSTESTPTSLASKISKRNKRVEEKLEINLADALPPTDNFRTSLLMPKLSARFSMLREQDDPTSILGKASDDSVLFPKRASRLNLFGHNPLLADIDEVSVDGSRPSINLGRTDSFASGGDGYGTDDDRSQQDSIMSRARRTEGNNLFGGRQKVYRIPAASNSGPGRAPMGRAVYEHDLAMSSFQRLKLKEKEEKAAEEATDDTSARESQDDLSNITSPNRTTYSSTSSGPISNGRTSTAATSIDEEPLLTGIPSRAAYQTSESQYPSSKPAFTGMVSAGMAPERGLVKSRRLYGQGLVQAAQNHQNSALNRLENLSRQRAGTPELPPLNKAYSRSATNLHDRLQKLAIAETTPSIPRPTSPPSSATSPKQQSIGADSKESKTQLVPGFGTPPLSPPVSENDEGGMLASALQPEDHGKATAMGLFNKPKSAFDENQFTRRQLQLHQGRNTPPPGRATPQDRTGRPRGLSNTSYWSRPGSESSRYSGSHRAESHSIAPSVEASPAGPANGTFFQNSSPEPSDDEDDEFNARDVAAAIDAVHPAFRSNSSSKPSTPSEEEPSFLPEVRFSDLGDLKPIAEIDTTEITSAAVDGGVLPEKPDSPTLGPSGLGLHGLIRTHLRSGSDISFLNGPLSPALPPKPTEDSNIDEERPAPAHTIAQSTVPYSSIDAENVPKATPFEDEPRSGHRRQESTETQREREEFANELAERRKRVQEKLRGIAENESRSVSPASGRQTPDYPQTRPGNAFAHLKSKNAKHPLFSRQEPKNLKVLGLENTSTASSISHDPWREEDERVPSNFGKHPNTSAPYIAPEKSMRSRMAALSRSSQDESRESSRSRGPSPHSSMRSQRDRSSSDASGRSKSRTRYRDRDDLGTLEEVAVGSQDPFSYTVQKDQQVPSSVASSTRPSVEVNDTMLYSRSSSSASGRYRSGSRSAGSSFQDRPLQPPPNSNPPMIGAPPRPSPMPAYSANATPPLYEISSDAPTTSGSGHAYPSVSIPQRAPGHNGLQKRMIDKAKISEPTFVSSTSNVPTVGLPPGASLNNGIESPPIPPMNPRRRRQTATQTIIGALKSEKHETYYGTGGGFAEEHTGLSDEGDKRSKSRNRLRKTSSEGGNLNARARQQAMADASAQAVPHYPPPHIPMEGGMF